MSNKRVRIQQKSSKDVRSGRKNWWWNFTYHPGYDKVQKPWWHFSDWHTTWTWLMAQGAFDTVQGTEKFLADVAPYGKIKSIRSDHGMAFTWKIYDYREWAAERVLDLCSAGCSFSEKQILSQSHKAKTLLMLTGGQPNLSRIQTGGNQGYKHTVMQIGWLM